MNTLAPLLQAFFTERLIGQREASPHTIASYRDAIRLLLRFAHRCVGLLDPAWAASYEGGWTTLWTHLRALAETGRRWAPPR